MTDLPVPDAILVHSKNTRIVGPYHFCDIASATSSYHHRDKLRSALTNVYQALIDVQVSESDKRSITSK
ncbi:MAG: hypothetical protein HRU25_08760 [Psychrobium sp.]|nr:hypothetical protein [Psychrobium sp.]